MKPLYFFPEYSSIQACDPLVPRKRAAISHLDAIIHLIQRMMKGGLGKSRNTTGNEPLADSDCLR